MVFISETFENKRFWEETFASNSKIISNCIRFKENCSFLYKNAFLQSQELILSSSYLFFYTDRETIALVKIKWCLIESFYEELDGIKKFGFTVSKGESKLDFYTETPQMLEE